MDDVSPGLGARLLLDDAAETVEALVGVVENIELVLTVV